MTPIAARRSFGTKSRPSSTNRAGGAGSRRWSFWATQSWLAIRRHARIRRLRVQRLRCHLHLPPLDLDEARELLEFAGQDHIAADRALEELHRDARGNASGLLRLAQREAGAMAAHRRALPDRRVT